jgi:DNA polymerase/3'-5' exonuclease PolX
MTNEDIAQSLRRHAAELSRGGDNLYRVRAFRQAAMAVLALPEPVTSILESRGRGGLVQVPGIGRSLAGTIAELARTGDRTLRTAARREPRVSPRGAGRGTGWAHSTSSSCCSSG